MIKIADILDLVDDHIARTKETMTELSRRATGSTETIRNWKRRLEKGEDASASFQNVQAVLEAIGVEVNIEGSPVPIRGRDSIIMTLGRIDGLDEKGAGLALDLIEMAIGANQGKISSQTDADGRSSDAMSRRGELSSQPRSVPQRAGSQGLGPSDIAD